MSAFGGKADMQSCLLLTEAGMVSQKTFDLPNHGGVSEFSALKRNEKPQCVLGDQDTPGLPSSGTQRYTRAARHPDYDLIQPTS